MTCKEIKRKGWKAYKENFAQILLVNLIIIGVSILFSMAVRMAVAPFSITMAARAGMFSGAAFPLSANIYASILSASVLLLLQLIASLALMPFEVGISGFYLSAARNRAPKSQEIFAYYKRNPLNIIATLFLRSLIIFVVYILAIGAVVAVLLANFIAYNRRGGLSPVMVAAAIAVFIAIFIIFLFLQIKFFYMSYVVADDPERKPLEALKYSWNLTKGHMGKMIMLGLSFIGWYLLPVVILAPFVAVFFAMLANVTSAAYIIFVFFMLYVLIYILIFAAYFFVLSPYIRLSFVHYYEYISGGSPSPAGDGETAVPYTQITDTAGEQTSEITEEPTSDTAEEPISGIIEEPADDTPEEHTSDEDEIN